MEKTLAGADGYNERAEKKRERLNWIPLGILFIFFAGTWVSPYFYHVTEKYNSLIVFVALAMMFFINVKWLDRLKDRDVTLIVMTASLVIAVVNLFIMNSNKGCILIISDFLLIIYMSSEVRLSSLQMKVMSYFFLIMYALWFVYDRAYSYNSNTGATYTVFTMLAAMIALKSLTDRREIYGLFIVMALLRTGMLVLWHLARGAFIALVLFMVFYAVFRKFDPAKHRKAYGFLAIFAVFGSLMFVMLYVKLSETGYNMKMPFFYKNIFSGREKIWKEIWDMLKLHILTGIGSGYKLKSFFEYNIHNAMYDILAVHGIAVFAGAAFMIISRLLKMREHISRSRSSMIAAAALFAVFFESFIDMDLMWADYSPIILFLFLEVFYEKRTEKN